VSRQRQIYNIKKKKDYRVKQQCDDLGDPCKLDTGKAYPIDKELTPSYLNLAGDDRDQNVRFINRILGRTLEERSKRKAVCFERKTCLEDAESMSATLLPASGWESYILKTRSEGRFVYDVFFVKKAATCDKQGSKKLSRVYNEAIRAYRKGYETGNKEAMLKCANLLEKALDRQSYIDSDPFVYAWLGMAYLGSTSKEDTKSKGRRIRQANKCIRLYNFLAGHEENTEYRMDEIREQIEKRLKLKSRTSRK